MPSLQVLRCWYILCKYIQKGRIFMKPSGKILTTCGIIGGIVLMCANAIVHVGTGMTGENPDTGWAAMPSALCGISELLALIGAVGLLMGCIGTHLAVRETCGAKMQTFSLLPVIGIVGMPLFHGNINCIEPLIYQVLVGHGSTDIYADMDAVISGSFAPVDLLILVTFYLQLIVLIYGTLSGRFRAPKWLIVCNPIVFLILGVILSNVLPSSVSGIALGMRNLGEGLMYLMPLAYWKKKSADR